MSFHGIAYGPAKQVRAHLPFDEIILSPPSNGAQAHVFIVQLRQYNDGNVRSEGVGAFEGDDPLTVREVEIQKDRVDPPLRKALQGSGKVIHPLQDDLTVDQVGGRFLHSRQRFGLGFD